MSGLNTMNTIGRFIAQVNGTEKRAGFGKQGEEANTEAGSIGGETTHPVADVDDGTEPAKEGDRSAENERDNKEDQPVGVDSTPEASAGKTARDVFARFAKPTTPTTKRAAEGAVQTAGSAADDHLQIGTNVQATGEDPANETGKAKAGKEDPGSSHPARTDNSELDGMKYSSDQLSKLSLEELVRLTKEAGDSLCASIAVEPAPQQTTKVAGVQTQSQPDVSLQAGWELAGMFSGNFDKKAADEMVHGTLVEIIKTAEDDADRVIHFMNVHGNKQADDGGLPPDPAAAGGAPPPGAGGPPPGGDPMGGGGGAPPPPGGDPSGGGDMMSALGGGGGGGADPGLQQLGQVCQMLQIKPEELANTLLQQASDPGAAGGAGGAGGDPAAGGGAPPPPGGAGGPPPGGDPAGGGGGPPPEAGGGDPSGGMETQAGDRRQTKTAAVVKRGSTEFQTRNYLRELMDRSRPK